MRYIIAKNGFLKTHIYEKCRPFFERLCGKNLKLKNFEFGRHKSKLIILTSERTGVKKSALTFSKKIKYFFQKKILRPFFEISQNFVFLLVSQINLICNSRTGS